MKRFFTLSGLMALLIVAGGKFMGFTASAQPESFNYNFTQQDYRGEDLVRTNTLNVVWNASTGVLTFNNFYANDLVNDQVVNLVFPSYATETSSPTTLTWESDTKANFTWRACYMGQSDVLESLPFSYSSFKNYKNAVVSRFQHVGNPVRIYDPVANTIDPTSYYAYYGGQDCHGTIDIAAGTIEITDPWGCVVGNNNWNTMSATVVIEYFERSEMTRVNTAINNVNSDAQVVNTRYYNTLGVESSTPFNGVNIIVNELDNGQKTVTKQLMR
ncbi:MAG: hypothetical protein IKX31_03880 [Muribaculaceae bacterium]|nr:hypothetical protein [Muribaculaceae bacterium]